MAPHFVATAATARVWPVRIWWWWGRQWLQVTRHEFSIVSWPGPLHNASAAAFADGSLSFQT